MTTQEYNSELLKKLQKAELEILKDFISICNKYDLSYFATGGTAIGALRHSGFIPWDDDIDVCMLRNDYEKFMEVAPEELDQKYVFMTTETEKKYPLMFGKMVKRGTVFVEQAYKQANYPLGIFIDIFPYDETPENSELRKKIIKKTWFWARMHVLTLIPDPVLPDGLESWKKNLALIGCRIIHYLLKLTGFTADKTSKKYLKWAKMYNNSGSKLYIDYSYENGENLMVRDEQLFPLLKMPFEDTEISMVKEYDEFLRPEYGDYMKLPPEDQRHNHYAAYIDFGE